MEWNGLVDKVREYSASAVKNVRGATVATGIGIAALVFPYTVDAQPYISLSYNLKDISTNQLVTSSPYLQVGQTYLGTITLQNVHATDSFNLSEVHTEFRILFGLPASSSNILIDYTPSSPPTSAGVPASGDLFEGVSGVVNNNIITTISSESTLNINRSASAGSNVLDPNNIFGFATFTITPQEGAVGGSLSFGFSGPNETSLVGGPANPAYEEFQFNQIGDIQFNPVITSPVSYGISTAPIVPEPSTYGALLIGGLGVAFLLRRKFKDIKNYFGSKIAKENREL